MVKRNNYEPTNEWLEQINEELRKRMSIISREHGGYGWSGLNMPVSQLRSVMNTYRRYLLGSRKGSVLSLKSSLA